MAKDKKNKKISSESPEPKERKRLFKKKRGGVALDEKEIREIKEGRKKLRADMKAMGIKSKKEFELTASSLGLYFDKKKNSALWWWFLLKYGGWLALAAALLLMLVLFGMSIISQLRGHFTINMTSDLFKEGFVLSETADFSNPTSNLFCTPAENVPDMSITELPEDIDDHDGEHHGNYFAYTYYIRNEGESTVGYKWSLELNSESQSLSKAVWVMLFEDGKMSFYAKARDDGSAETLPPKDRTDLKGYVTPPLYDKAEKADEQYEINVQTEYVDYWRITPYPFEGGQVVASGEQNGVKPGDVHKYTVVIWLEGDDPDCTNELIGGHLGFEMNMSLIEEIGK